MYIFTRIIPILVGLVIIGSGEYAFAFPHRFIVMMGTTIAAVVLGTWLTTRRGSRSDIITFASLAAVTQASVAFVLFFIASSILRHAVLVAIGISFILYLEELYRHYFEPDLYHKHALEHLAGYFGVVSIAGSLAGIFALRIFLDTRLIYLLPLTFVIGLIVTSSVLSVQPLSRVALFSSAIVFSVFMTELSWAVHFLPTDYLVDALIVTIPFYMLLHIVRHELNKTLSSRIIRRYVSISIFSLILVAATAQWVL